MSHVVTRTRIQLISPWWRIYALVNWVRIGSDNGLSPIRHQAIIKTNAGLLSFGEDGRQQLFHFTGEIWYDIKGYPKLFLFMIFRDYIIECKESFVKLFCLFRLCGILYCLFVNKISDLLHCHCQWRCQKKDIFEKILWTKYGFSLFFVSRKPDWRYRWL